MKILISIGTLIVVATALTIAWRSHGSTQESRTALAEISARREKLKADIDGAERRAAAAKQDEGELQNALNQIRASSESAAPAKPAPKPNLPPPSAADAAKLMDANPELRALFRQATRANVGLRYRPMYAAANLTPEQIHKFEDLMAEDAEEKIDLAGIAQKQGAGADDPVVRKMRQESEAKLTAAQREALGEAGYQQLQEFNRSQAAGGFVAEVANLVSIQSTPLTESQVTRLRAVVASTSAGYRTGGKFDMATVDWPGVLTQSQAFLSPEQFVALKAEVQLPQVFTYVKQYYQQQGTAAGK